MLNDNIKALRMAKGLSQEELASRIHVVRQTISKWEKGISVPDAEALTQLAEVLETTVPTLLGEALPEPEAPGETLAALAEKLSQLNDAYIRQQRTHRRIIRGICIAALVLVLLVLVLEIIAALWGWRVSREMSSAIGIIGGADGPTRVFVSSVQPHGLYLLAVLAVGAAAVFGLFRTRRSSER